MKKALDKYTEAIKIGNVSAMMYTKRADMLLKSKRPLACIADCDAALEINPDSAKAFRLRGKAHRKLGHYEEAHKDISVAQKLDFDDDLCEMQQFVAKRWTKISEKQNRQRARQERIDQKKKMADMKRRKEQAQREYEEYDKRRQEEAEAQFGGMPGGYPGAGGMPGGMPAGFDPSMIAQMFGGKGGGGGIDPSMFANMAGKFGGKGGGMPEGFDPSMFAGMAGGMGGKGGGM